MKAIISSILLLVAAAVLVHAQNPFCQGNNTDPTYFDLGAAIIQWNQDVINVNQYLDNRDNWIHSSQIEQTIATIAARNTALDEPCLLELISNSPFDRPSDVYANSTCAVNTLKTHFPDVIQDLNDFLSGTGTIFSAIADVSAVRCCYVLPALDILWSSTISLASLTGQGIPSSAPRPGSLSCDFYKCQPLKCPATDSTKSDQLQDFHADL